MIDRRQLYLPIETITNSERPWHKQPTPEHIQAELQQQLVEAMILNLQETYRNIITNFELAKANPNTQELESEEPKMEQYLLQVEILFVEDALNQIRTAIQAVSALSKQLNLSNQDQYHPDNLDTAKKAMTLLATHLANLKLSLRTMYGTTMDSQVDVSTLLQMGKTTTELRTSWPYPFNELVTRFPRLAIVISLLWALFTAGADTASAKDSLENYYPLAMTVAEDADSEIDHFCQILEVPTLYLNTLSIERIHQTLDFNHRLGDEVVPLSEFLIVCGEIPELTEPVDANEDSGTARLTPAAIRLAEKLGIDLKESEASHIIFVKDPVSGYMKPVELEPISNDPELQEPEENEAPFQGGDTDEIVTIPGFPVDPVRFDSLKQIFNGQRQGDLLVIDITLQDNGEFTNFPLDLGGLEVPGVPNLNEAAFIFANTLFENGVRGNADLQLREVVTESGTTVEVSLKVNQEVQYAGGPLGEGTVFFFTLDAENRVVISYLDPTAIPVEDSTVRVITVGELARVLGEEAAAELGISTEDQAHTLVQVDAEGNLLVYLLKDRAIFLTRGFVTNTSGQDVNLYALDNPNRVAGVLPSGEMAFTVAANQVPEGLPEDVVTSPMGFVATPVPADNVQLASFNPIEEQRQGEAQERMILVAMEVEGGIEFFWVRAGDVEIGLEANAEEETEEAGTGNSVETEDIADDTAAAEVVYSIEQDLVAELGEGQVVSTRSIDGMTIIETEAFQERYPNIPENIILNDPYGQRVKTVVLTYLVREHTNLNPSFEEVEQDPARYITELGDLRLPVDDIGNIWVTQNGPTSFITVQEFMDTPITFVRMGNDFETATNLDLTNTNFPNGFFITPSGELVVGMSSPNLENVSNGGLLNGANWGGINEASTVFFSILDSFDISPRDHTSWQMYAFSEFIQ